MTAPLENMAIAVRGYAAPAARTTHVPDNRPKPLGPSAWSLTFDCETTVDAAQRVRFGVYQLRKAGRLEEVGIFFDPEVLKISEQALVDRYAQEHGMTLRTVCDFVKGVFLKYGYNLRGTIIGFNLPFDIARIAIEQTPARGKTFRGGFSFVLLADKNMPRVQVKHLSSRAALIQFTVPAKQRHGRGMRRRNITVPPRRGFFVDVKTLAAAMTGRSHSLASLGALLGTAQRKLATDGHGARLTQRYLDYAVADVATTWECYALLSAKYKSFGLSQTRENQIFSEAGIGKAHFREIGIVPWREVQSDFSPKVIGNIVSTYFGGRSDVNIRREVRQVLYCDFLSMYPTVCTLMGLWQFVIAKGIEYHDATDHVRTLLEHVTVAKCLGPEAWRDLAVIVQIKPNADPLPVRARYDANRGGYTIGLNDLTSDAEHWYTLADCIVASLLTGRPPKVIKALRLTPLPPQECLKPASIAGRGDYQVDPLTEDFYRRLIDLRTETKKKQVCRL